jgi:hypothetical protein
MKKNKSQTHICATMKAMRLQAGVSMQAVADEAGYSQAHYCMLELGQRAWNEDRIKIYTESIRRAALTKKQKKINKLVAKLEAEGYVFST